MSETTNLKLKKHDNVETNTNQFDIENYMNGNWDKIDEFAGEVNEKVIEIEDSIDLVKQRTEQAVEDIQTDLGQAKEDIEDIKQDKLDKAEYDEAILAIQAELLKATEENKRLKKDIESGMIKGEAAGESLYLADSSDARFRSFEIGGNSRQETREGYNLIDINKFSNATRNGVTITKNVEDGSLTLNGTATGTFAISIPLILTAGTVVSYSLNNLQTSNEVGVRLGTTEGTVGYLTCTSIKNKQENFTVPENTTDLQIRVGAGEVLTNFVIYPQLEKSSVLHDFELYGAMPSLEFPSSVEAVKDSANVTVCNKNVLDVEKFSLVGGTVGYHNKTFVKKLKAGSYTLQRKFIKSTNAAPSAGMVQLHKGSVWFKNLEASAEKITFTIEKDEIMKFIFLLSGSVASETESTIEYYNIQLEKGETETDYIEHQEQNLTVPVQQPMLEGDKFVKEGGKWYEIHTYKKLNNYTATSAILRTSENRVSINYFVDNIIPNTWTVIKNKAKCNRFKQVAPVNVPNGNCFAVWNGNGNIAFTVDNSYLEDVSTPAKALESWNSLLEQWEDQGESLEMYYQLQAPEKIECTEEQSQELDKIEQTLHSYKGGTHVYSADSVSLVFNVEYTKDMEACIEAKIANVTNAVLEIGGNANV